MRKGGDERTHQIHIFHKDDKNNLVRHLAVRDYLISHEEIANEYGELKEKLALRYPYDISNSSETHLNGIPLKICDKNSTLCRGRKVGNGVANYN